MAYAQQATNTTSVQNQGLNIEISPARLLLVGEPGKKIDASLQIRNRNAGTEKLRLDILKVKASGDRIELITPAKNDEFSSWVKFGSKIPFDAPYNQIQTVPVTINIPKDAAFGYYYAIVISKASAPVSVPGATQAIEGKVAQIILLDVKAPGAKRTIEIKEFQASRHWYEFLPADFTTIVTNTGNVHAAPQGNIFIKSVSGHQIGALDINAAGGSVLPQAVRTFSSEWNQGFPHYETVDGKRKLVWNWNQANWFRVGKYKADLVLVYNDGQRDIPVTSSTTFWVVPWRMLLVLLVILLLVLGGLFMILRGIWRLIHRNKKHTQEQQHEQSIEQTHNGGMADGSAGLAPQKDHEDQNLLAGKVLDGAVRDTKDDTPDSHNDTRPTDGKS